MKIVPNSKFQAINLLKEEYKNTEGLGKILITAMFFNIPFLGFIIYLTQVITVIILSFFLRRYLAYLKENQISSVSSKLLIALTVGTMIFQADWIPFATQIITLILLGILYAFVPKGNK